MPTSVAPARKRRCDTSGVVARFSLTCIEAFSDPPLIAMEHPPDQAVQFMVCQWTSIRLNRAVRYGGAQQRPYRAFEFLFERSYEIRQPVSKAAKPYGLDPFSPGILVVRRQRINLFEQHLGSEFSRMSRQFGAAVAGQRPFANDGGGQR